MFAPFFLCTGWVLHADFCCKFPCFDNMTQSLIRGPGWKGVSDQGATSRRGRASLNNLSNAYGDSSDS